MAHRDSRVAPAEVGVVAVAVAANLGHHVLPAGGRLAAGLGAASASVLIARRGGAGWSELGLGRREAAAGLRWGAGVGAALVVGIGTASRAQPVHALFADDRVTAHVRGRAAYELAVRIPFETALAEELIFRGALFGLAMARRSTAASLASTSVLFGLWHIRPTWSTMDGSAVGSAVGNGLGAQVAAVAGVVVATTCAGAAFGVLRVRSGSVIAPALAHAALNMTSFAVARSTARPRRRPTHVTQGVST